MAEHGRGFDFRNEIETMLTLEFMGLNFRSNPAIPWLDKYVGLISMLRPGSLKFFVNFFLSWSFG